MPLSRRRKIIRLLCILLGVYGLWLGFQWARFRPKSAGEPAGGIEVVGVYHVHSRHSDGTRSSEAIARTAARQGLDFIVLTDHGNPHPSAATEGRWQDGVLVLAGSELSVNRGHLVALGFDFPQQAYSSVAEEAAHQIREDGGFTVIAHPYSKVHWSWGDFAGYSGIEIISADAKLRKNWPSLLLHLPFLLFEPRMPLLKLLSPPTQSLRRWDELCRQHSIYGYFSCDAHLYYRAMLSFLRLYVLLPRQLPEDFDTARQMMWTAFREGRFYNCVDAAAPGYGFRFWASNPQGRIPMGASETYAPSTQLHIQMPNAFSSQWRLLRDGEPVLESQSESASYTPAGAGTYRVEVYLRERTYLPAASPWIISNPIFLKEELP